MKNQKKYLKPRSLEEAIRLSVEAGGTARYIAGGTDLMVNLFQANDAASCLIDLNGLAELRSSHVDAEVVSIGALVNLEHLQRDELLQSEFTAVGEAVNTIASPVLRKSATIGGNLLCENRCSFYNQSEWWRESVGLCLKCDGEICIATRGKKKCFSKFASDLAPVLISMDATVDIASQAGMRRVAIEDLYTGDGVAPRNLRAHEIIAAINIKRHTIVKTAYRKLRPRLSVDFSSLTTAVSLFDNGSLKLSIASVDPAPISARVESNADTEHTIQSAYKRCRVIDNDYYPRWYRREMILKFLRECFGELTAEKVTA